MHVDCKSMPEIYFHEQSDNYYIKPNNEQCSQCKEWIAGFELITLFEDSVIKKDEKKKDKVLFRNFAFYCDDCEKEFHPLGILQQKKVLIVTDKIPKKSIRYFFTPPELIDGSFTSCFNVSAIERMGGTTEDHTVHAGRDSIEGEQIGDTKCIDDGRDKELSKNEAHREFIDILLAEPDKQESFRITVQDKKALPEPDKMEEAHNENA